METGSAPILTRTRGLTPKGWRSILKAIREVPLEKELQKNWNPGFYQAWKNRCGCQFELK